MREPIKHHYIPKFLLKSFCTKDENVNYFDLKSNLLCMKEISNIFYALNLYRDEINSSNPVQIEVDLSRFENEASLIIKKLLLDKTNIEITLEEYDKLQLFFAVMGFRSKNAKRIFTKESNKDFYSLWQEDGNISDFWKRNLSYLVRCRNIKEVLSHPNIDEPIKIFMARDILGATGSYFVIAERRGNEDFVLSDAYPVTITGEYSNGKELRLYAFFPLSPKRCLIVTEYGVESTDKSLRCFNDDFFNLPYVSKEKKTITFHVRKIYEEHVDFINKNIIKNTVEGFIAHDVKKVKFLSKIEQHYKL